MLTKLFLIDFFDIIGRRGAAYMATAIGMASVLQMLLSVLKSLPSTPLTDLYETLTYDVYWSAIEHLGNSAGNYDGSPTLFQNLMNFAPLTDRTVIFTHPPKILLFLHCRASHTQLIRQNSTKLWRAVSGKPRQQTPVKHFCSSTPQKFGTQKLLFSTTSQFNGKFECEYLISGVELDIDNRETLTLLTTRSSLHRPKIS